MHSLRLVSTEDGDYTEQIDETVKKMLETSLIAAVMKFDPCKN
ncbi:helix-turn-helix domain-containing protein [Anaerotignum lactatifermentans]|nr:helix-turn-helix domain-containing protein [Anaerotignum lactatifermentans]